MKKSSDTKNQFLRKIAPVHKLSIHEKGIKEHCPRYSRASTMLEKETVYVVPCCYIYAYLCSPDNRSCSVVNYFYIILKVKYQFMA